MSKLFIKMQHMFWRMTPLFWINLLHHLLQTEIIKGKKPPEIWTDWCILAWNRFRLRASQTKSMWRSHEPYHIHHNSTEISTKQYVSQRLRELCSHLENSSLLSNWSWWQSQHVGISAASLSQSSAAFPTMASAWLPASGTWLLRQWHHYPGTSHNSWWCAPALLRDPEGNDSTQPCPGEAGRTDWWGKHWLKLEPSKKFFPNLRKEHHSLHLFSSIHTAITSNRAASPDESGRWGWP